MGIILQKLLGLFSWRKLPGLALSGLGLVWRGADYFGRIDILSRVAESVGGTPTMIVPIISSIWFSVALIVIGIGYVVFIGEPEKGVQTHPAWPYVGWSIFVICLAAVASTTIYGFYELQLRRAYAAGAAGIPRNTSDANTPVRPQTPLYTDSWGSLSPDQVRILLVELPKLKPTIPMVRFFSVPNDNEGYGFWRQFDMVFKRSGMNAPREDLIPRGPEEEGLMLAVRDPHNLSTPAESLREAFEVANIQLKIIPLSEDLMRVGPNPIEFGVFIGPHPIRWH